MLKNIQSRITIAFFLGILTFFAFAAVIFAQDKTPENVIITNNQPFPVRIPIRLKGINMSGEKRQILNGQPVQKDGSDLIFVADLAASDAKNYALQKGAPKQIKKALAVSPIENGISLNYNGVDLGQLSWDIIFRNSKPEELKGVPFSTKEDFSRIFEPLALKFERIAEGAVFDVWRGVAVKSGLQLSVELRAFHDGFLDINSEFKNVGAEKVTDVYAAVLTRWRQPAGAERSVCYDYRINPLKENDWTNFRVGESRNWYVQRGVDWIRSNFQNRAAVALMHDFAQSFTVHQTAAAKRPARWVGANIPQIGYEAQTAGNDVYSLTEIARSNLRSYAERLEDNRLMPPGESVNFTSRLAFSKTPLTDEQVDDAFVAYAGYAEQKRDGENVRVSLGVPYTRFGTNYFPYSTLGENFDLKKLPGMDRDSYWALAADTVKQWRLFADDIKRDLRIAKTLGFEIIRLHHLELINAIDKPTRFEYLDFLFGEMKNLGFKVLIDAKMSAADTAELVKRYRDLIEGVEVDNEVLIFGINDDAPAYWKRVYAAVKEVAPEIPVHLTAHTNMGVFDRLTQLGVSFDKIGQHAYADGLDSLPNTRAFALASGSYGRRAGKPPIITEWNWRFLTRMTPEDRAKVYAPIFENVLKTRSMPTMYQFQFNETLAMNPRVLKGIRHYEQIWLSRRPKPEAFVLSDLIKKYSAPTHANRLLEVNHAEVNLNEQGQGTAQFRITNTGKRELNLKANVESPANLKAVLQNDNGGMRLKPNETKTVSVALQALPTDNSSAPLPGFYHVFLRLEGENELLRYGWAEARLAGSLPFDSATKTDVVYGENAAAFDFNRPLAVVYGDDAPIQDVETAYAVVNAVESATGRPVKIYTLKDLPDNERTALLLVGTAKTNKLIASVGGKIPAGINSAKQFVARVNDNSGDWLVMSGAAPLDSERAAMDWLLRFWTKAKDSAARRVGLVEKELPLGFDPAQLP